MTDDRITREFMSGKVWLVGAGPGDRGLFTLKGLEVLQSAEVVVYDALIGDEILTLIPEKAEKINVGKRAGRHRMVQEQINRVLLEKAREGLRVVRLKGGDPFVFGRGGEELELLAEHGIPYEVVPGVTSAFAVPAYNGIPVTHRDFTSSVHIITGHRRAAGASAGKSGPDSENGAEGAGICYEALVRTGGTLVFLMGLTALPSIMRGLMDAGMDPDLPAAVLEKGTTAGQRRVVATVSTLEAESARARIQAPAIIVVGEVCRLSEAFAWAERRPLAGRKILLTRPKELSSEMAARLRRLGAEVLEIPAIETVPIEPNPALEACTAQFTGRAVKADGTDGTGGTGAADRETEYTGTETGAAEAGRDPETSAAGRPDWLVFTSPTGVRVFMDRFLEELDIRALAGVRIAAIGKGSARKLREYGLRPEFVPSVYDGGTLGRELAAKIREERIERASASGTFREEKTGGSPAAETLRQEKTEGTSAVRILIPRAAAGGQELIEELKKAGDVEIVDLATYDTLYRSPELIDLKDRLRQGEIDLAVFTSASTVRGFCAAVKGDCEDAGQSAVKAESEELDLSAVRAVCIGRQTRTAAEAAGMRTWTARQATLDALEEAVVECAAKCRE